MENKTIVETYTHIIRIEPREHEWKPEIFHLNDTIEEVYKGVKDILSISQSSVTTDKQKDGSEILVTLYTIVRRKHDD